MHSDVFIYYGDDFHRISWYDKCTEIEENENIIFLKYEFEEI